MLDLLATSAGARYSFMSEAYAAQLDECVIDRSDIQLVRIGNGGTLITNGTVKASLQFPGEGELFSVLFHLLSQCSYNVILGNSFLKLTELFTNALKYARHVIKRIFRVTQGHYFFYISGSGLMFRGRTKWSVRMCSYGHWRKGLRYG
jgi:hypothetical protein